MVRTLNNLILNLIALVILIACALPITGCRAKSEHSNKAVAYQEKLTNSSGKAARPLQTSDAVRQDGATYSDSAVSFSSFTVAAVGDVNTGSRPAAYVRKHGYPIKNLKELLEKADLTFGNLECALSSRGSPVPGKRFTFRGSPQDAHLLKDTGFDVLSIANNHSKDYGNVAFQDTLNCLDKIQVAHAGGGKNAAEAYKPAILAANETRIAFLAFSDVLPAGFAATKNSCGVASLRNKKAVVSAIKEAKSKSDVVIVSLHWGKELSVQPSSKQIALAHQLIDAGADAVIGHHPHVVQGIEIYKGKPIAYSLGNFMFSPGNSKGRQSVLLSFKMENGKLVDAKVYPVYIDGIRPELLSGKRGHAWLSEIARRSKSFKTRFNIRDTTAYASVSIR